MVPFDNNLESFDENAVELEVGVFRERLEIKESDDTSTDFNETTFDVFGKLDSGDEWQLQEGILCDSIAINCGIGLHNDIGYYSQEAIIEKLIDQGLYSENEGLSVNDTAKFMMLYSPCGDIEIYVEEGSLSGLNELCTCIEAGETVICYVNSSVLYDDAMADIPGLNADQMIHVIGIDMSDGENEYVVVNDTAEQNGSGKHIPLNAFLKAWATNDFYAISLSPRRGYAS